MYLYAIVSEFINLPAIGVFFHYAPFRKKKYLGKVGSVGVIFLINFLKNHLCDCSKVWHNNKFIANSTMSHHAMV